MTGAYYCIAWATGANPTAKLRYPANTYAMPITYYLNGQINITQTTTGADFPIFGMKPNATNQLMVLAQSSTAPTQWGFTGANFGGIEIDGFEVDAASSAGTAPAPCQPTGDTTVAYKGWIETNSDSIGVGFGTNNYAAAEGGGFPQGPFYMLGKSVFQQGYDIGNTGVTGSGVNIAAGTAGSGGVQVPGYYVVSGGTYSASASRWNLVDRGCICP